MSAAGRDYDAARFADARDPLDPTDDVLIVGDRLADWGTYTQLIWGFEPGWSAGLRFEYATGQGLGVDSMGLATQRRDDPYRADRFRWAALLTWSPSEFSKFRLQYNLDDADHIADDDLTHSLWLSFEILIGTHPAHTY